jgi:macrolide transport system ATP-binding/permease protein
MIEIKNITKQYHMGSQTVRALDGVSLTIEPGDFIAIMGPSGSGKSTLMHILGLLDVPDSGSYLLYGKETSKLDEDDLAVVRRNVIGFIFQQFNLLPRTTALENVALPQLYSQGTPDLEKAKKHLDAVGLGSRVEHRPNELSGGQQQRVAIARSLINDPGIILADEPTGNLDSKSEKEIMQVLQNLNDQGITIILVTHEEEIAQHARRIIRMRDGKIQTDERNGSPPPATANKERRSLADLRPSQGLHSGFRNLAVHFGEGIRALTANKVRSGLSMLGILIGVAAVIAMLALGRGARDAVQSQLASLGSNLLVLRPGAYRVGGLSLDAGSISRLTLDDHEAVTSNIKEIRRSAPIVNGRGQAVFSDKNWSTSIIGTSTEYAEMKASVPIVGRFFEPEESKKRLRVAVIGLTVVDNLFGDRNPIGEWIKINAIPFQVIGILPEKGNNGFRDADDVIVVPLQTAMHRLLGKTYLDEIDLEINNAAEMDVAQEAVKDLIYKRHKVPPSQPDGYQIRNMADIQAALSESSRVMSWLLASIAAISLLVGGIGIMNIMLVSVTERTREIGLRKAVGARRSDILSQFLIEAIVVSVTGGLAGILLGCIITVSLAKLANWATTLSPDGMIIATVFSAAIGIVFGIWPARKASFLSPIQALRHE